MTETAFQHSDKCFSNPENCPDMKPVTTRKPKWQFVWWGEIGQREWFGFYRYTGGLAGLLNWSLYLGPLEIRRWT